MVSIVKKELKIRVFISGKVRAFILGIIEGKI